MISLYRKCALFYIGTEAEFIKLHPVINRCINRGLDIYLLCNGQNDLRSSSLMTEVMSAHTIFLFKGRIWSPFTDFSLRAVWLFSWGVLACFKTTKFLMFFTKINKKRPVVIVHGDTLSTLIGGVVAKSLGLRVIHVESGLTSGSLFNPFPEEFCRRIVSRIADVRLCSTLEAFNYVPEDCNGKRKLYTYGNTMWDALQYGLSIEYSNKLENYFVLVIHRQETLANPTLFLRIVDEVMKNQPLELKCIFVLHATTKSFIISHGIFEDLATSPRILLMERQPFVKFSHILRDSTFVLTDGGSNQEECYYLGVPCYLLRARTERSDGFGHNVVHQSNFVQGISWFMQNFGSLRRKRLYLSRSPSDVVTEEITRECLNTM